jgi:hypothetical protein
MISGSAYAVGTGLQEVRDDPACEEAEWIQRFVLLEDCAASQSIPTPPAMGLDSLDRLKVGK